LLEPVEVEVKVVEEVLVVLERVQIKL